MSYDELITKHYPGFKLRIKPGTRLCNYVQKIMVNSYERGNEELRQELPSLIRDVEDFFRAGIEKGYFLTKDNKFNEQIIDRLERRVDSIGHLPPEYEKKVFGHGNGKTIQIRRESIPYHSYAGLNSKEVRRMYLYHELGHKILNIFQNNEIFEFVNTFEEKTALKGEKIKLEDHCQFVNAGTLTIEECLTQELGESLAFHVAKKKRPDYTYKEDLGQNIRTNHSYYCIFQQPVIDLGKTLKYCGNKDDSDILKEMIKKALTGNFVKELILEYDKKDNGSVSSYQCLHDIFWLMGIICTKKYDEFGQSKSIVPNADDLKYAQQIKTEAVLQLFQKKISTVKAYKDISNEESERLRRNSEINDMLKEKNQVNKPRNRRINETDESYETYLKEFYNNGNSSVR